MHVRISTIEGDAGRVDDAVGAINEKVLPVLKGTDGFTAANVLTDRTGGKVIGTTFWEGSPRSRQASRWSTRSAARLPTP